MIRRQTKYWNRFLSTTLEQLSNQPPLKFSQMEPSLLPKTAGVYLITKIEDDIEIPYYVGRTKNIQKRLYKNHRTGSLQAAPLKKYLVTNQICSTEDEAKDFILKHCAARWIEEKDYRRRGAMESFYTATLFPEYGINEED